MSDIGFNDNVQVYGRKFHVQTATNIAKGIASCEVFEEGRLINKNYINYERRKKRDNDLMENRVRNIVESIHQETLAEIELMFVISKKIDKMNHAASHVKMGLLFVKSNLMSDAIDHFKKAIEIDPEEINAYNNLGLAYIHIQAYGDAVAIFKRALTIQPTYADVHYNMGIAFYHENNYVNGLEHIQKALRINPEYHIARYYLALLYLGSILAEKEDDSLPPISIRVERAIQQLQILADGGKNGVKSTLNKIKKALQSKDVNAAVNTLNSNAVKIFPDEMHSIIGISFYLRFMYGGKSLTSRTLKKFEDDLINSIETQGDYADLWNNLGIVHLIQCRNLFLKALNEFNRALDINPKFEKALKNKKLVENDGKEFLILLRAILK